MITHEKNFSQIYFIFYIPGSMGSLLSVLLKSQLEKNFTFDGFNDNTAHKYSNNAFHNCHNYKDFINFQKNNLSLEEHLSKNIKLNCRSIFQTCDINWCKYFQGKNYKSIICYLNDNNLKLENLYIKLKNSVLSNVKMEEMNFNLSTKHKNYEKLIFIKTICWWINQEKKFLKFFPKIDLLPVIKKHDITQLETFCKITNKSILHRIIDDYNKKQVKKQIFPEFSKFIKNYLEKYS